MSGERTVVDLFAGAGGASEGLRRAGLSHLACVERDADACETLRAAELPAVEADAAEVAWSEVSAEAPWMLWSSFPCQPFSSAGKRRAARDPRDGWPLTVRAVDELEPRWLVAENVRGLTFHSGGEADCDRTDPHGCPACYLSQVILEDLRARFPHVQAVVLDAADYGVPQHRRRLIIVAGPRPIEWPDPTHGPPGQQDMFLDLEPWVTVREALGLGLPVRHQSPSAGAAQRDPEDPAPQVSTKGTLYVEAARYRGAYNPVYHGPQWSRRQARDRPSRTIDGASPAGGPRPPLLEREDPRRGWEPACADEPGPSVRSGRPGGGLAIVPDGAEGRRPAGTVDAPAPSVTSGDRGAGPRWLLSARVLGAGTNPHGPGDEGERTLRDVTDEPSPTVAAQYGGGAGNAGPFVEGVTWHPGRRPELLDEPSETVSAVSERAGSGPGGRPWKMQRASDRLYLATGRRRLTVEECSALQAFPEGWPFAGNKTSRYRQVGNAVPPPLSRAVAEAVLAAEEG